VSCVQTCVERGKIRPADFVVITGPGPIGLMCAQVAKLFNPRAVFQTGLKKDTVRLQMAKELGVDYTYYNDENIVERIKELTGDKGADIAIECSGDGSALNQCIEAVKPGGQIVVMAMHEASVPVNVGVAVYNNLVINYSWAWDGKAKTFMIRNCPSLAKYKGLAIDIGFESWLRALDVLALGKIKLEPLITHILPLEKWEEGFDICENKTGIKVVTRPYLDDEK
jgi:threonine dehydrogenase-like Zn-dependent dehydrogenase